jgi:hypothetical protein
MEGPGRADGGQLAAARAAGHPHPVGPLPAHPHRRHDRHLVPHQIRGAAVDAILTGAEKIIKAGLLAVDLDIASRRKRPDGPPAPNAYQ